MGYAVSWLAVSGKAPQALFRELGIAPTGEMAAYGESMIAGRTLPNGWFLLVIDRCDHKFIMPESLRSISSACEAVACSIEEHVMFCSSELWRNGVQVWRIEHDAQKSIEHISTSGQLPDDYAAIEEESAEQQKQAGGMKADTDYFFEIPLQAARGLVGFKHDEACLDDESFEVFEGDTASPVANQLSAGVRKQWWKLW